VRNHTGRRPCDTLISRCFGRYHAGAHSANLGLPSFRDGVRGERLAAALGIGIDPEFDVGRPVRRAIEVYPHPAIVALFDLPQTLKYKGKPGRTVESRKLALSELLDHLESLRRRDPPLDVTTAPRWQELRERVESATAPIHLSRVEDEIDSIVCAYVVMYFWAHGTTRCRVAGNMASGYIVTPVSPAQGECLDSLGASLEAPSESMRRADAPTTSAKSLEALRHADVWSLRDLHAVMAAVANARPVFHSEADFQHAFAWQIHKACPEADVRLETRPSPGVRLDVLVRRGGTRIAIELKYLLRKLTATWNGEQFELPMQSAHDVRRYDFIKDIVRLEALVPSIANVGFAVALTNDPGYWQRSVREDVVDAEFRLHDGRELAGSMAWDARASAGTMRDREAALAVRGVYVASWRDFSEVGGDGAGRFRYLAVEVK
jgi:predicted RNase H-like nuclease